MSRRTTKQRRAARNRAQWAKPLSGGSPHYWPKWMRVSMTMKEPEVCWYAGCDIIYVGKGYL